MIRQSSSFKLAGYSLALGTPLLAPLGVHLDIPWLAPAVVFGVFPILSLLIGEERSLPIAGLRSSPALIAYLDFLPRVYGVTWIATVVWAAAYAARADLGVVDLAWLVVGVGLASTVAICTAHELMHRRSQYDVLLGRVMSAFCLYGQMYVEHMHHHARVGEVAAGQTPPRGISVYRFAPRDVVHGLRNAWGVERNRLRRAGKPWWHNMMIQDWAAGIALGAAFFAVLGRASLVFFVGQAVFAVYCFEVITYVHHYGLVREETEEPGPQHAWAHHCWLTNCLTFNNTFHSDHHLRPRTPYYELHGLYGAPHLPAGYITMFCVALVPPLWRRLMDRRLDALAEARRSGSHELEKWLQAERCR